MCKFTGMAPQQCSLSSLSDTSEITLDPLNPYLEKVVALLKSRNFSPRPTLSNNEREDHSRISHNAQTVFRPKRFLSLEPYIRQLVNDAVNRFEHEQRADLVKQMVYELPGRLLGLLRQPGADAYAVRQLGRHCGRRYINSQRCGRMPALSLFGFGRHVCMGAPLARFELMVILEELGKRLPGLRLVEGR